MTIAERLPEFNLVVSIAALVLLVWAWWAHRLRGRGLRAALLFGVLTLICGSAFQAGLIGVEAWTVIGSVGRLAILSMVVLAAFDRGEPVETAIVRAEQKIAALNGEPKA